MKEMLAVMTITNELFHLRLPFVLIHNINIILIYSILRLFEVMTQAFLSHRFN